MFCLFFASGVVPGVEIVFFCYRDTVDSRADQARSGPMTLVISRNRPILDNGRKAEGDMTMSATMSLTDRTVGELAAEMPVSIRIFEAWKIDYCCGGGALLNEACAAAGRTIEEFTTLLVASASVPDGIARDWSAETLAAISAQIIESYHCYTREELQTLTTLAARVLGVHGQRRPELTDAVALVQELTTDLLPHMLKEEQVLFPYVVQLESAAVNGTPPPTPFFGTVKNPVKMMMLEHDRVGALLTSLRAVTNSYTPPGDACFSYRELYRRLGEFESRTHEHIHIENNVYFPRAVTLEETMDNAAQFGGACGATCGGH